MRLRSSLAVAISCALVVLAGCQGGGAKDEAEKSFSIAISEPHTLFPPSKFCATWCGKVVDQLWTGLVEYENREIKYRVAESITSKDNVTWTIKLKRGWKFHNGEPVDADAFIRAWNFAAYGPNAATKAPSFEQFKGFDEINRGKPTTKQLAGVKKESDYELTVSLKAPFSQFPQLLTDTAAFAPVSKKCMANKKACNEGRQPVGNGPWTMAGKWQHDKQIVLKKWSKYTGPDAAKADKVTFKIYDDMATAFRDYQAGDLDIVAPTAAQASQARQVAGDRVITAKSASFSYLGLPLYVDYLDDPKVRHALSMAIDRQQLIDKLLNGLGTPAKSAVSPFVEGGGGERCEYCEHDPKRARQLMGQTDGLPKKMTLWVNSGADNNAWVKAVANQWSKTFGVKCEVKNVPFSGYLDKVTKSDFTGPYRLGWDGEFPSMENYLKPTWFSGTPTNKGVQYSSPKYEDLVNKGSQAGTNKEAIKYYQQAEDVLLEDMPIIPVLFEEELYVYSDRVGDVKYFPASGIDVSRVTVD